MTNTKKITKRESFTEIKDILEGLGKERLVKVMEHELELLAKKNSTERKLSGNALANIGLKEEIMEILANEPKRLFTATEVQKAMSGEYSNQRVSALLKQLKEDGKVIKIEDKRKSFFQFAE